jgi:hypothetical protein
MVAHVPFFRKKYLVEFVEKMTADGARRAEGPPLDMDKPHRSLPTP